MRQIHKTYRQDIAGLARANVTSSVTSGVSWFNRNKLVL